MPIYLHSEQGLTVAVFRTALHCYLWILFAAGQPNRIIEWGEAIGRHGRDQAVLEAREEMMYQVAMREGMYNGGIPLQARHSAQPPYSNLTHQQPGSC